MGSHYDPHWKPNADGRKIPHKRHSKALFYKGFSSGNFGQLLQFFGQPLGNFFGNFWTLSNFFDLTLKTNENGREGGLARPSSDSA